MMRSTKSIIQAVRIGAHQVNGVTMLEAIFTAILEMPRLDMSPAELALFKSIFANIDTPSIQQYELVIEELKRDCLKAQTVNDPEVTEAIELLEPGTQEDSQTQYTTLKSILDPILALDNKHGKIIRAFLDAYEKLVKQYDSYLALLTEKFNEQLDKKIDILPTDITLPVLIGIKPNINKKMKINLVNELNFLIALFPVANMDLAFTHLISTILYRQKNTSETIIAHSTDELRIKKLICYMLAIELIEPLGIAIAKSTNTFTNYIQSTFPHFAPELEFDETTPITSIIKLILNAYRNEIAQSPDQKRIEYMTDEYQVLSQIFEKLVSMKVNYPRSTDEWMALNAYISSYLGYMKANSALTKPTLTKSLQPRLSSIFHKPVLTNTSDSSKLHERIKRLHQFIEDMINLDENLQATTAPTMSTPPAFSK